MSRKPTFTRTDLWLYVLLGTLLAGFGSAAYFDQEGYNAPLWLGPFLLWVAAVFTLIGVIGLGVSTGLRVADYRSQEADADEIKRPHR